MRVHCQNVGCLHKRPMALAPLIIRWGPDASSDMIRNNMRCTACGRRGVTLQHPSWTGRVIGWQPFPVD